MTYKDDYKFLFQNMPEEPAEYWREALHAITDLGDQVEKLKENLKMEQFEKDAVRDVIEALVAELGPDNVPVELDVDGAVALLAPEIEYASEEENAQAAMEASAELSAAEVVAEEV